MSEQQQQNLKNKKKAKEVAINAKASYKIIRKKKKTNKNKKIKKNIYKTAAYYWVWLSYEI